MVTVVLHSQEGGQGVYTRSNLKIFHTHKQIVKKLGITFLVL